MGKVFSPLDEELGLLPSNLAPRQHEHLVHLACFMPFDKVVEMMQEMVSVQTHEETVRRLTEQAGSWMEAAQIAEVEAGGEPEPEDEQPLERCVFSADGAMISLVNKQWVETRTVAIGEPQEKLNAQGETEIHVSKLSYFSRLADAVTFTNLAEVEIRRRRVREAKEVCAVMDGADWLQFFTEGKLKLSNGYDLSWRLVMSPHWNPFLKLLHRRQNLLLCQRQHLPHPLVRALGTTAIL